MSWIERAKIFAFFGTTLISLILIFDLLAYWFLPSSMSNFAINYRVTAHTKHQPIHANGYPRFYFRTDDLLGFDIQPDSKNAIHNFADASIPIFSNDLGCFDEHSLAKIRSSKIYDYFAGDSFTWGYANYQSKFATVYERKSGRFSVKCGVTHTGQRHQFEKFLRVSAEIGNFPRRVIVGYVPNDPANDYAHPHTTVIDGYQVDTVELISKDTLSIRNMTEIHKLFEEWSVKQNVGGNIKLGVFAETKNFLKKYSLTANLLSFAKQNSFLGNKSPGSFYGLNTRISFDERFENSSLTENNRNAIIKWAAHSAQYNYELIFVLIPVRENYTDIKYYDGLKRFLDKLNLDHIDLTEAFKESDMPWTSFYWKLDGHLSNEGNEFVGNYLAKRLR